jgi:hypothetical protein
VALNGPVEYAIWLFPQIHTAVVRNNAIYDYGNNSQPYIRVDRGAAGLIIGGNSISKSDGKPPRGSPYSGDLWMVEPRFVNFAALDFHLLPTSALIDAGVILDAIHNDFEDNARPRGRSIDIGAFEKQ